jgi:arsenate-mycothiol transferase
MNEPAKPSVLFVCVKNAGKSQMAAGLMRQTAGDTVNVYSAGTQPGAAINALSAQSLGEIGVDITDKTPKLVTRSSSETSMSSSPWAAKPTSTR